VRGTEMDGRSDLYSVGVLLYELLTGRRPFVHDNVQALMMAHAHEPPPRFADLGLRDTVPPALEAVVMSCLAKIPNLRPRSAQELALAYEKALGRRLIVARAGNGAAAKPINGLSSGVRPALPTTTQPKPPDSRAVELSTIRQSVEAIMPEAMAMIKLKGFIYDLGGQVVESVPGLIKVRLIEKPPEPTPTPGRLLGWGSRKSTTIMPKLQTTDLELHMERRDPSQSSRLTITLVMRPNGCLPTPEWRSRCGQISRDLQAYLMGR
jgi:hypothetical protein